MRSPLVVDGECDFKPKPGLGGWRVGRVLEIDGGQVVVTDRRGTYRLPRKQVRGRVADAIAPRAVVPEGRAADPVELRPALPAPRPPQPKETRLRSERYLAFVRELPCCGCGKAGPSDPHHYGPRGLGQKTDDFRTVPLCRRCHDSFHAHRAVPPWNPRATHVLFLDAIINTFCAWIRAERQRRQAA